MRLYFNNVDVFCAGIDLIPERPRMDLSKLEFIEPFAVVYLGQFIRHQDRRGKHVDVTQPPATSRVFEYLNRIRFWERFNLTRDEVESQGLLRFASPISSDYVVELAPSPYVGDDTALLVEELLKRLDVKVDRGAVLEAVEELADNFAQHAGVDLATLAAEYLPNRGEFVLAIGDSGLGIRATLSENPKYDYLRNRPHWEAIVTAFDPLASRRLRTGTGLTNVLDQVQRLNGEMKLASNDGYVYIGKGHYTEGRRRYELPGVQIELRFPEER